MVVASDSPSWVQSLPCGYYRLDLSPQTSLFCGIIGDSGCISLLLTRLSKLPSQCYLNGPDNFVNLGNSKEMQPYPS